MRRKGCQTSHAGEHVARARSGRRHRATRAGGDGGGAASPLRPGRSCCSAGTAGCRCCVPRTSARQRLTRPSTRSMRVSTLRSAPCGARARRRAEAGRVRARRAASRGRSHRRAVGRGGSASPGRAAPPGAAAAAAAAAAVSGSSRGRRPSIIWRSTSYALSAPPPTATRASTEAAAAPAFAPRAVSPLLLRRLGSCAAGVATAAGRARLRFCLRLRAAPVISSSAFAAAFSSSSTPRASSSSSASPAREGRWLDDDSSRDSRSTSAKPGSDAEAVGRRLPSMTRGGGPTAPTGLPKGATQRRGQVPLAVVAAAVSESTEVGDAAAEVAMSSARGASRRRKRAARRVARWARWRRPVAAAP